MRGKANSFHEKAGERQVFFLFPPFLLFAFFFSPVGSYTCAKPPLSPSFHPHSLVSDIRSVLAVISHSLAEVG